MAACESRSATNPNRKTPKTAQKRPDIMVAAVTSAMYCSV